MQNNTDKSLKAKNPGIDTAEKRKLYTKPHLEEIGDLRTTTLGASGGPGESGASSTHRDDPLEFPY